MGDEWRGGQVVAFLSFSAAFSAIFSLPSSYFGDDVVAVVEVLLIHVPILFFTFSQTTFALDLLDPTSSSPLFSSDLPLPSFLPH
jgi:hypothetical protein